MEVGGNAENVPPKFITFGPSKTTCFNAPVSSKLYFFVFAFTVANLISVPLLTVDMIKMSIKNESMRSYEI